MPFRGRIWRASSQGGQRDGLRRLTKDLRLFRNEQQRSKRRLAGQGGRRYLDLEREKYGARQAVRDAVHPAIFRRLDIIQARIGCRRRTFQRGHGWKTESAEIASCPDPATRPR